MHYFLERKQYESWDDYCVRYMKEERKQREMSKNPLSKQVDGTHYKECAVQPVKYITRHKTKGEGSADIKKVIHYAELILELVYGENKT